MQRNGLGDGFGLVMGEVFRFCVLFAMGFRLTA